MNANSKLFWAVKKLNSISVLETRERHKAIVDLLGSTGKNPQILPIFQGKKRLGYSKSLNDYSSVASAKMLATLVLIKSIATTLLTPSGMTTSA